MPDQPESHPAIEKDLSAVAAEVAKHREAPENRLLSSHELVRKAVRSYTENQAPTPPAQTAQPSSQSDDSALPAYAQSAPSGTKLEVEHLLSLAFREGILKATSEASRSNPYVLDTFHDALAGKLYPELKKRGLVE